MNLLIIYNDLNVLVFLQSKTGFWIVFECCLDRKSALKYEHYSSCFEKCQNKEHIKDRSLAGIKYNNSSEERDTSEHLVLTLHSHRQAQRHSYSFYLSFSSIIYVCLKQWSWDVRLSEKLISLTLPQFFVYSIVIIKYMHVQQWRSVWRMKKARNNSERD